MRRKIITIMIAMLFVAGAFLLMFSSVGTVSGATLYVGTGSTYDNIQDAINASTDGDIIYVANGTYNQMLNFTEHTGYNKLTIIGNGSVTIAPSSGDVVNVTGGNLTNLELINLTITSADGLDINATGGAVVTCHNVVFTTLSVDHTAELHVFNWITPIVYYMGGADPVDGADLEWNEDAVIKYSTPHYLGASMLTGPDGTLGYPFLMKNTEYINDNTSMWTDTWVSAYKLQADIDEVSVLVDTNNTGMVDSEFAKDIRAPDMIENVTVHTLDQFSLNITWNATAESPFINYTVYTSDSMGLSRVFEANTTDNWYVDTGLMADTTYYYKITVTDNASLESVDSEVANGTTAPYTNGTVQGSVIWDGVPLEVDFNGNRTGTVELLNETMVVIATAMVNETDYNYTFLEVDFQTGLMLKATPDAEIMGEINITPGWMTNTTEAFELNATNMPLTKDVIVPFHVPPIQKRDVTGQVVYSGGPMDGENATEVTAQLFHIEEVFNTTLNTTVEIATLMQEVLTNNVTGIYTIPDVVVEANYTIKVMPKAADKAVIGVSSGYLTNSTDKFDVEEDMTINLTLEHYLYIPPPPKIIGQVTYGEGNDTLEFTNATEVTVKLLNETRHVLATAVTHNVTGAFVVEDLEPGINLTLQVTPPMEYQAVIGVSNGYLIYESVLFNITDADATMNVELLHYEYSPQQPLVIISKSPVGIGTDPEDAITVQFNYPIAPHEFESAFAVSPEPGNLTFTWETNRMEVAIDHDDFEWETTYEVTINSILESEDDVGFIFGYADNVWQFTTVAEPPPPSPDIWINEPADVTVGGTVTISGGSYYLEGETVTVTLDDETETAVIQDDGTWEVKIGLPDIGGTYKITAESGIYTNTTFIEVNEESEPFIDLGFIGDIFGGSLLLASVCCGSIALIIIVIIIVLAVLIGRRKKTEKVYVDRPVPAYTEEEEEEIEEEEEYVDEDEEEIEDEEEDEDEEDVDEDEEEIEEEEDEEESDAIGEPVDEDEVVDEDEEEVEEEAEDEEEASDADQFDLGDLDKEEDAPADEEESAE